MDTNFKVGQRVRYIGLGRLGYTNQVATIISQDDEFFYILLFKDGREYLISSLLIRAIDEDQYNREQHALKFL